MFRPHLCRLDHLLRQVDLGEDKRGGRLLAAFESLDVIQRPQKESCLVVQGLHDACPLLKMIIVLEIHPKSHDITV